MTDMVTERMVTEREDVIERLAADLEPAVLAERLRDLRVPFGEGDVGKLPKPTHRGAWSNAQPQGCDECGGWHPQPAVHLSYVGHAAVTDRLLAVDPTWNWAPLARDAEGLPVFERDASGRPAGLWILLTVLGVTRLGYGSVDPNAFDAVKQLIGDAIRNAAMRFGVALDMWRREEPNSGDGGQAGKAPQRQQRQPQAQASRQEPAQTTRRYSKPAPAAGSDPAAVFAGVQPVRHANPESLAEWLETFYWSLTQLTDDPTEQAAIFQSVGSFKKSDSDELYVPQKLAYIGRKDAAKGIKWVGRMLREVQVMLDKQRAASPADTFPESAEEADAQAEEEGGY